MPKIEHVIIEAVVADSNTDDQPVDPFAMLNSKDKGHGTSRIMTHYIHTVSLPRARVSSLAVTGQSPVVCGIVEKDT